MHKTLRPANVYFLETKFDLTLSLLVNPLTTYQRCDLTYFLHLLQLLCDNSNLILSTPTKASTTKSSDSEQRSLFSVATNLNSKFMTTLGRVVTVVDNGQMTSIINIPDSSSIFGTSTPPPNTADNGGDGTSGNEDDNTQPPSDSNHGFDKVTTTLDPKTAQLLANRRAHGGKPSRSYYGPLGILDVQVVFDGERIRWNEMFQLGVNNAGRSNVVECDSTQKKVKKREQEILIEVFCDRYYNNYVGALLSVKDIKSITVE